MSREPRTLRRADWERGGDHLPDGAWRGRFEGRDLGTNVCVLFFASERVGAGPVLHTHPYDEVFVVRQGRARFTIGETTVEAGAGDVLLAPAGTPHRFENLGPGALETTDIHLSDRVIQTDLEEG